MFPGLNFDIRFLERLPLKYQISFQKARVYRGQGGKALESESGAFKSTNGISKTTSPWADDMAETLSFHL